MNANADSPATCPWASSQERVTRIAELCLVLFVVFATFILTSVYPHLTNREGDWQSSETPFPLFLLVRIMAGLMVFTYVLWRNVLAFRSPDTNIGSVPVPLRILRAIKRISILEWCLVLFLSCWEFLWSPMQLWIAHLRWTPFVVANLPAFHRLVEMLVSLAFLVYVLNRTGRSFGDLGLRWTGENAALAMPLLLVGILLHHVQMPLLYWLGVTLGPPGWHAPDVSVMLRPSGVQLLTIGDVLLVGFYEELIVRAFVMTEIIRLTNRPWMAVVISVAVQTSYHFYQGVPLALSHVGLFTLFALFYARTRLILPVALAHSVWDLYSNWNYGLKSMYPY